MCMQIDCYNLLFVRKPFCIFSSCRIINHLEFNVDYFIEKFRKKKKLLKQYAHLLYTAFMVHNYWL